MGTLLIRGGRVLDPSQGLDQVTDLWLRGGRVVAVAPQPELHADRVRPVARAGIMRRGLEYCRMFDRAVFSHAEDPDRTRGGLMHGGFESMRLGLRGMPSAAEEVVLFRDLTLAERAGARLHVLHV